MISIEEMPARRRDAEENRARIIAAAREVFLVSGFDAPLDAIARRAGVGRATLYRNFADRYALGAAIITSDLGVLEQLALEKGDRTDGLMMLLSTIVEDHTGTYALVPALLHGPSGPVLHALAPRVMRLFSVPLENARAAGLVRDDLTVADVIDLLTMVAAVVAGEASALVRRQRASRAFELLLHGIVPRPDANTAR
ncbi:MAG TPA: TetR/AcrR family transcriptional regulator [Polyangium sp.]|nr:TetR/AcrR family transcriptional regulator [Polyangium sp.]